MLRLFRSFVGYTVSSLDGEAGETCDIYFDGRVWDIRHIVVDTGTRFPEKKVLLNPFAIRSINDREKVMRLRASRGQIRSGPSAAADPPVSLQEHRRIHDRFWWIGLESAAPGGYVPFFADFADDSAERPVVSDQSEANPNLRSALEVLRYRMENRRREIGQLEDLIFDDVTWQIDSAVVYVTALSPARMLVIPVRNIVKICWEDMAVSTGMSVLAVGRCPAFRGKTA